MIKCNNPFCYNNTELGCAINMRTLADCEAYQSFVQHSKVNQIEPLAMPNEVLAGGNNLEHYEKQLEHYLDVAYGCGMANNSSAVDDKNRTNAKEWLSGILKSQRKV